MLLLLLPSLSPGPVWSGAPLEAWSVPAFHAAGPETQPPAPISRKRQEAIPEAEARQFAGAWAKADLSILRGLMDEEGIRLNLPGENHLKIRPDQAEAALGVFLRRYARGSAQVGRVSLTGGNARRGFAEVRWTTTSPGVMQPVSFTIFVGFALRDEGWAVTEIRILY